MTPHAYSPAHWVAIDLATWVAVRERLPRPLTEVEALQDLRFEATKVALGYQRRMAGRTKLRSRWGSDEDHPGTDTTPRGWSDYEVKRLLTAPAYRQRWQALASPGNRPPQAARPQAPPAPAAPAAGRAGRAAPTTDTGWDT